MPPTSGTSSIPTSSEESDVLGLAHGSSSGDGPSLGGSGRAAIGVNRRGTAESPLVGAVGYRVKHHKMVAAAKTKFVYDFSEGIA